MSQPCQRLFRVTSCTLGVLFAAFLSACGAEQPIDSEQASVSEPSESEETNSTSSWIVDTGDGPITVAPAGDEGAETSGTEGGVEAMKNCVYIDWCNEPGARGTVCRAKAGCASLSALVKECNSDAKAVCGRVVAPAHIDLY